MKRCSQCKTSKPVAEFYRDRSTYDGLSVRCKPCARAHSKARHDRLRSKGVKYGRSTEPKRCAGCHAVYPADSFGTDRSRQDGLNVYCKRCAADKRGKPGNANALRAYRARHPERSKARGVINNAIRRGLIPRPTALACFVCSQSAAHYHHHRGYDWDFRYHVIPVCVTCHERLDHGIITVQAPNEPPVYVPRPLSRR